MKFKVIILLLSIVSLAYAEVEDKWRINLGSMFVTDFSTQMQIAPAKLPIGVMLDTKDNLGMDYSTSVFRLDGYYRFTNKHSIDFSYFGVRSDGTKTVGNDFTFDEYDISAGAAVNSYFNMDVFKVNYGYSFYHNDKVELLLSAGLHVTVIDLGLSASGHITDSKGNHIGYLEETGAKVTIPLPVLGFKGGYAIVKDTLFVVYRAEYFRLKVDGYEGNLVSTALTFEYRFYENYGVGLGYNTNRINLDVEDKDTIVRVRNNLEGVMLNLNYTY